MFERASLIHPGIVDGKVDVGRILESLLYYKHVDAVVDGRLLPGLWTQLGSTGARDLLSYPSLNAEITAEMPVVHNQSINGMRTHAPVFMALSGKEEEVFDPVKDPAKSIHQMINNQVETPFPEVKKFVAGFKTTSFEKAFAEAKTRGDLFESLIQDSETMRIFLKAWAENNGMTVHDEVLNALEVNVLRTDNGFLIANNLNLADIVTGGEPVTNWDQILAQVHDYALDLHLAQARSADVITNDANSRIAAKRIDLSINRASRTDEIKSSFEEFAFDEARPFREAFNAGQITLKEALEVIDQTAKFRDWLNGLPPSADLIAEYHRAVTKDTILGKLPGKGTRFAVFTGAGVALDLVATGGLATAAAVGLSAFDDFIVDGLFRGWRPNHFVETLQKALPKES